MALVDLKDKTKDEQSLALLTCMASFQETRHNKSTSLLYFARGSVRQFSKNAKYSRIRFRSQGIHVLRVKRFILVELISINDMIMRMR